MARVETYELKQTPSLAPNTRSTGAITEAQATIGAKQLSDFGKGQSAYGADMAAIEIDQMEQASKVRVDEALNRAKEEALRLTYDPTEGYTNLRGKAALERPDGRPLAEEYSEKLSRYVGSLSAGLGNEYQRAEFMRRAGDMTTSFKGNALQHEGTQFREYSLSVHEGTIENARNSIMLNWDNPQKVAEETASLQTAVYERGRIKGDAGNTVDRDLRVETSKAHLGAITAALQSEDPVTADEHLRRYSKDMDAGDIIAANKALGEQYSKKTAILATRGVMAEAAPRLHTPDTERAFNIALGTESSYQQFDKKGNPTTSEKGATGIAQVMPETGPEAAALAGVEWNPELFNRKRTGDPVKDAEAERYSRALGQAYFNKQLQDFGSLPKAYAAYNAGPGALREALKKAEATGQDWRSFLPTETKNYITKNMDKFYKGGGAYEKPSLAELQARVRERVGPDDPEALTLALNEITRQYKATEDADKLSRDTAMATAMKAVNQSGGDLTTLPADVRSAVHPDDLEQLTTFARRVAGGEDTTNLWLYNKLSSDPAYLKTMSDGEFIRLRSELSQQDFRHFTAERNRLLTGKTTDALGELNTEAMNSTLNDRLRIMGIDPSPKDGGDEAARVGAIRKYVTEMMVTEQATRGKKMTDIEVSQFIDGLFAKTDIYDGIFSNKSRSLLAQDVDGIPRQTRNRIRERFKAIGVDDPSDGDLLHAYFVYRSQPLRK